MKNDSKIPHHIAIIMDGNGRWAEKRGLPRNAGHMEGAKRVSEIVEGCLEIGVEYLSIYAFSKENWRRPREEVTGIMRLTEYFFKHQFRTLRDKGVYFVHLGEKKGLPDFVLRIINEIEKNNVENPKMYLCIGFNYSGRDEIVRACRKMFNQLSRGDVSPEDINERTNKIIKEQVQQLKDQFSNIKSTVSENLQKLRLGVIRQAVDQMIEKIVDKRLEDIVNNVNIQLSVKQFALTDELKKFSQGLNAQVLEKLRESIKNTLNNLKGLKLKKDEDKDKIYETLTEDFDKAVKLAEERIENISGGVFEWFGNIRNIFSEQIVSTLETTLNDILKKLEVSEKVTKEFWEQAKQRTGLTMKDIWFIRSMESAKAHINEEITKAKMRVLIIAPNITDINIDAIKSRPSHINFRIATYFDLTNPKHAEMITELDKLDNVDYRFRHLQNLWGINRDYEEVIVCVLSKAEIRGETVIEIAGIGSIIEEHIKIFVPILEEAWMNAKKEIIHSIPILFLISFSSFLIISTSIMRSSMSFVKLFTVSFNFSNSASSIISLFLLFFRKYTTFFFPRQLLPLRPYSQHGRIIKVWGATQF